MHQVLLLVMIDRKAREVLTYIRGHPGCNSQDVKANVFGSKSEIDSAIFRLRSVYLVENREEPDQEPRWIATEVPVQPEYLAMAKDFLQELESVPQDQRETYLARRLEEMMRPL